VLIVRFLKRLLGSSPAPARPVTQLPEDGYLQVAGEVHYMGNLGQVLGRRDEALIEDVPALLVRDPGNAHDTNAIEVWIYGVMVGHLPRDVAAAWNPRIAEIENAGGAAGIGAHLWYRRSSMDDGPNAYVNVRLSPKPLPPRRPVNTGPRVYANTTCPYCSVTPDPLPKARSKKCRACGQSIYVREGPEGLTYLLQEADLSAMEQAWVEHDFPPE
jgi:hypothetical protein